MDSILGRPDNIFTRIYEFGDNILYSAADILHISYYDLCTYIFVYLYFFIVALLLLIIICQQYMIWKKSKL